MEDVMIGKKTTIRKALEERGGSMVEFTVLMLIFVPLVLLPMYFQDALRYKLDTQEAVFSSAWDFTMANYEKNQASQVANSVDPKNREIYDNLWSGNERQKDDYTGPWAHFEWKNKVKCDQVDKNFAASYPALASMYHNNSELGTKGGLVTCKGQIAVKNYYIPQVFMQDFAEEDHFVPKNEEIVYNEYKFGVLVDPWTIHEPKEITPQQNDPQHPFYKRVDFLWKTGKYMQFVMNWNSMAQKMSRKISKSKAELEGTLDNPTKLKLCSIRLSSKEHTVLALSHQKFFVTPFKDGDDDMYEKTFENRGDKPDEAWYLGCKGSLQDNCGD
jgi:hypothetical protein